jgi:hypothetical protein
MFAEIMRRPLGNPIIADLSCCLMFTLPTVRTLSRSAAGLTALAALAG